MARNLTFLGLLAFVTLAFGWVLWPLFSAVFWAVTFVIVLDPLARRMAARFGGWRNLAALTMVLGFALLIILPTLMILATILQEATRLAASVQSGQIDLHLVFQSVIDALPVWTRDVLLNAGMDNLTAVQATVAKSFSTWIGDNAPAMLSLGQNTAGAFVGLGVMLYLMFFLFRDGEALLKRIKAAIPMEAAQLEDLLHTFTLVVRATVRGDIMVALLQGGLGGLGFWFLGIPAVILWTVLM